MRNAVVVVVVIVAFVAIIIGMCLQEAMSEAAFRLEIQKEYEQLEETCNDASWELKKKLEEAEAMCTHCDDCCKYIDDCKFPEITPEKVHEVLKVKAFDRLSKRKEKP